MSRLSSSNLAILRPGINSQGASEWLEYEGSVTLKLLIVICHQNHYAVYADASTSIIEVAGMGPISRAVATKALRAQQRGKCTPFMTKIRPGLRHRCGNHIRIISGFGRSSLRRKPNTTSEELRAAVESTRPARNLEIYLWSRVLLDQRPGGTSPLFFTYSDVFFHSKT